ncbi:MULTISPECIES: carbohydrate ABC transporter permease [unclassified Paenibacillus]|uniref:carbohydrate ABC transporter permease n=1 Tax=unclassified Paenibacillus TaxID=185978 RepID=UPI0024070914|nr:MULTISPECIES: carbohydrate ABC transporter permease [unclassified Paenibacillus]MDF9843384.1 multiple sugar transport system permease protein [Paenibacillus sp. PastF-2]MDF9849972.1 multiple sugar transport system permease protein [Paenibacillus sp. PastM-2]MDF9856680.1 multiple sugar transport system permease protein [Paenibacillus sp. PastF-1]MDH6481950.1 multiple sugar transport system permease protein [Paenibacillus sp. PastH-2]MDH6509375.1 multiple sugar transport system permease prote
MKNRKGVGLSFTYIIITVIGILFALPFLYTVYTSFLTMRDVNTLAGPSHWTLDNYKLFFTNDAYNVPRWFLNTVIMTGLVVLGNLVINPMAGFALAKLEFKGKKLIYWIVVATMMVPYHMILIPVYVNMAQIGWMNTYPALTVPFLFQCLYIFMLRQFFVSVPGEFIEAARIDGVTKMGAFWRIVYPLGRSSMITMSILAFAGTWNSYLIPSTLANTPDMYVLVVGLNSVKDMFFENTPLIMAGVVLSTLPILVFFFLFQRQYIEGISSSGVKG